MSACRDVEVLVSLRAAGASEGDDARLLDAHLAGCERCRREVSAIAVALRIARVPLPSQAERRAVADLADRALGAYGRYHERRSIARRIAAAGAISAALVLALLVPITIRHPPPSPEAVASEGVPPAAGGAVVAPAASEGAFADGASEGWQEPDLDVLWADAAVVSADLAGRLGD